jgi:hypothetical protein
VTSDPLATPPRPAPAALRAATRAELDATAISPEAEHLQWWLAELVEQHERRVGLKQRRRRPEPRRNLERALGALVADLLAAPRSTLQEGLVYRSRNATAVSKSPQTYDGFTTAIRAMHERELIEVFDGFNGVHTVAWDGGVTTTVRHRKAARYRATPTLLLLAREWGIALDDLDAHFQRAPPVSLLALKGKSVWVGGQKFDGPAMELPDTPQAAALSARVAAINAFVAGVEIGGASHRTFFRGFAMGDQPGFGWDKGGRLYSVGRDSYQQLPQFQRLRMTLNGEPVVEIDVRASFLTILHGLTGNLLEMGDDAYAFEDGSREVAKAWLTASIGSGKPISRWPKATVQAYRDAYGVALGQRHPVRDVAAAMMLKFPALRDLSSLGLGWSELMFVESEAIIGAMEDLQAAGVASLPVHDSLVVPARHEQEAITAIQAQYIHHAGIRPCVSVKRLCP